MKDTPSANILAEKHYLLDGSTLLAVTDGSGNVKHWNMYGNELLGREEANGNRRFYVYDHVGSTRQVIDANYDYVIQELDYYPFGLIRRASYVSGTTKETFTGKELDEETGLYYFGARYYDAALGRWSVMDPAGQYATSYGYSGGNPVMYVDEDGELAFLAPILVAAAIGAGTSAAVYSATAGPTGNWNLKDFGKSAAFGAVSGAISGGIGSAFAGSAFGQSASLGVLSNSASTISATIIFGQDITVGTIAGGVAGGLVSGTLPRLSGVKGSAFANVAAEVGVYAGKGAITGAISGGVAAGVDGRDLRQGITQGAYYGAIGGVGVAGLNILTMGAAYRPDIVEDYDFGGARPIYRRGTGLTKAIFGKGSGVALGNNLVTNRYTRKDYKLYGKEAILRANAKLILHETIHHYQIQGYGFGRFYGRTLSEYLRYGIGSVYDVPWTLEWRADKFRNILFDLDY